MKTKNTYHTNLIIACKLDLIDPIVSKTIPASTTGEKSVFQPYQNCNTQKNTTKHARHLQVVLEQHRSIRRTSIIHIQNPKCFQFNLRTRIKCLFFNKYPNIGMVCFGFAWGGSGIIHIQNPKCFQFNPRTRIK
ncbi:MAG: hypothetical protein JJU02_10875, partial [Cryomorphaceae bacterium]|nr:hypothetical protein [Cryomorphaceae bacterium]